MATTCFYFQVHQPWRLRRYRIFDIGKRSDYFSDDSESNLNNARVLQKVARKSYLPTNELMLHLLNRHPEFAVSYSLSGVLIEQLKEFAPEVLDSFKKLVDTGRAEILSETYHHSLSFLYSPKEFRHQVGMHRDLIRVTFGVTPTVFRNTELIYSNDLAREVESLGYDAVLSEGADHILGWRSPGYIYNPPKSKIKVLLKNYRLSDDVAFRFSSRDWTEYPLTSEKYASWLDAASATSDYIGLFMDYETFGEHQWEDTGIFKFLEALPAAVLRYPGARFGTPPQSAHEFSSVAELNVPHPISWADTERDLSAWRSNEIQNSALDRIYALEDSVLGSKNQELISDWRRLQTSDHFYYMCTKWFADGDVHAYFNPYETPYDAYISFMNALHDLELRVRASLI